MGHPAYEARREAERLEAEQDAASARAAKAAAEAFADLMTGKAYFQIVQPHGALSPQWNVRIVRDVGAAMPDDDLRCYLDPEYVNDASPEHLAKLLKQRDEFIVNRGLWDEFVREIE